MPDSQPTPLSRGLAFAQHELGEWSAEALRRPTSAARFETRVQAGFGIHDAVLAEVHRAARQNRRIADEFVAYFLQDMLRVGRGALRAGLRRYLDTGDLVQSVLGDLWDELTELEFESRARFISLLGRRLQWKAADHARRLAAGPRREDREVDGSGLGDEAESRELGPATRFELDEETERLALVLHRLGTRDRRLLQARLQGRTTEEIARAEGLQLDSARKAILRARERAQTLLRPRS